MLRSLLLLPQGVLLRLEVFVRLLLGSAIDPTARVRRLGCKEGCGLYLNFELFWIFELYRTLTFRTYSVPHSKDAANLQKDAAFWENPENIWLKFSNNF